MKIAIFSDTFPPQIDGVAAVAYQSAQGLAERGHEVTVFAPQVAERKMHKSREAFRVIELPSLPFFGYPGHRIALPLGRALSYLRSDVPDVIHSHTPFAAGWEAARAAKTLGVPLVGTHHTFFDHYLRHVKLDYRWMITPSWRLIVSYYNRCAQVLSPSAALIEAMRRHGLSTDIAQMPNPVDTELFQPARESLVQRRLKESRGISGISLVYMGRLSYEKSIDQVIRAFAIARRRLAGLMLTIIGDGPERRNLEALAARLGLSEAVVFTGFRRGRELADLLRSSDIFVTASKSENMPVSVLEGMAAGLPIIGVNALGIPEIVREGENGFIAKPDSPDELAEKIGALARDQNLMQKFSQRSREIALGYSRANAAGLLETVYQNLVSKHIPSRTGDLAKTV